MAAAATAVAPEVAAPVVADEGVTPTTQLTGARPPQMASLYIGDLDPNVREPQLLELFKACGTVLGVRVCRDIITQRSLGYGYVNFQAAGEAEKALETLNFAQVGDRFIRLMWQQRDPSKRYSGSGNIFVKNLDTGVDSKGLHDLFKKFGAILSCKVMSDEAGKSRGYGFVHFKDENAASSAIEKLNGQKEASAEAAALYVAHFIRRNARIAALLANFTNVYIKQVLPTVDKDKIEAFFAKFGGITSATARKDAKGRVFAFCNFDSHDAAVKCIEALHDKAVDDMTAPGERIYVQRAQPRSERLVELRQRYMQRQALGNNLYVRNFGPEFKDENLHELFREFGEIKSCRVMVDEEGNSRGFGFVSFIAAEHANSALREMNGRMLNGKPLVVNIAQRRDQRYSMLQVQFQQRMQALLRQLPMLPFVPGMMAPPQAQIAHHHPAPAQGPRRTARHPGGKAALPAHRRPGRRGALRRAGAAVHRAADAAAVAGRRAGDAAAGAADARRADGDERRRAEDGARRAPLRARRGDHARLCAQDHRHVPRDGVGRRLRAAQRPREAAGQGRGGALRAARAPDRALRWCLDARAHGAILNEWRRAEVVSEVIRWP